MTVTCITCARKADLEGAAAKHLIAEATDHSREHEEPPFTDVNTVKTRPAKEQGRTT